ncbi:hypothetical protein IV203_007171 [Nitzschia inconspicua]|uniref:Uncharacterized protein n=1 Tax=Nitzschia inconspicua TaxID=303405 RepID=A0A9K3KE73_9STRA|nr:hypothetical protein IV203_007171 [Nitzschia inconspicua]
MKALTVLTLLLDAFTLLYLSMSLYQPVSGGGFESITRSPFAGKESTRRCIGSTVSRLYTIREDNLSSVRQNNDPLEERMLLHQNTTCTLFTESTKTNRRIRKNNGPEQIHVMMFLTDNNPRENRPDMITLAAALLRKSMNITILIFSAGDENTTMSLSMDMKEEILIQVPLGIESNVYETLKVRSINIEDASKVQSSSCFSPNHHHPMDKCSVDQAPKIFEKLERWQDAQQHETTSTLPDVLIMDTGFLGGLLHSESRKIPTVTFGSFHSLPLAVEHDSSWKPSLELGFLNRMVRIFQQRIYSLSLTLPFLALNQVRHSIGLSTLKSPGDCFRAVSAMLIDHCPKNTILKETCSSNNQNTEKNVDMTSSCGTGLLVQAYSSFVPSCIPCSPQASVVPGNVPSGSSLILLVVPPNEVSAQWKRNLIRGIIIARQSLENYDDCSWDAFTCENPYSDFQVLWLDKESDRNNGFPLVRPAYIFRETNYTNLLDVIVRYPLAVVAMLECNSTSYVSTAALLGVSILCIAQDHHRIPPLDSTDAYLDKSKVVDGNSLPMYQLLTDPDGSLDPTDVATQILHLFRQQSLELTKRKESNYSTTVAQRWRYDGLSRAVDIVETVAKTHRKNQPWIDLEDMRRATSHAIHAKLQQLKDEEQGGMYSFAHQQEAAAQEDQPYDSFTVSVSWLVLVLAVLYLALKDIVMIQLRRRIHNHQYIRQQHFGRGESASSDGILSRLHDLDDAWHLLQVWHCEHPTTALAESLSSIAPGNEAGPAAEEDQRRNIHTRQHHHNHNTVRRRRKARVRQT